MNSRIIRTLILKDLALFSRNMLFVLLTILSLGIYLVIYHVLPADVDERLEIGLYAPVLPPVIGELEQEGLRFELVESEEVLVERVAAGTYPAGVVIPTDTFERFQEGLEPRISVYYWAEAPEAVRVAIEALFRELFFVMAGQPLPVEISEQVLGPDMTGEQVPLRDRLLIVFVVLILVTEVFFLATLIGEEVARRTAQALLVTPATSTDLFVAKGILGVGVAFAQAMLLVALTAGFGQQPAIVLVALLLGAVLVTGLGFLIATVGKDIMSVTAWAFPVLILLIIPAMVILFPGQAAGWVQAIPSYPLVDVLHETLIYGAGWGELRNSFLILLGFNVVILGAGILALGRRLR
ncbi:MAG: ABC transporter permease [Dehalococcoidia bacterium]|nr:ABC transporter permease [Dehalococcoidia bacterium]